MCEMAQMMANRWCEAHKEHHGPLYVCPTYPEDIRAQIRADGDAFTANLWDAAWVKRQIDRGIPIGVILVMRSFSLPE